MIIIDFISWAFSLVCHLIQANQTNSTAYILLAFPALLLLAIILDYREQLRRRS